ncbi:MAG: sulfatase-like hydrolase/transferase [Firmicutes bacterium]|nr:sulfatase-like hydrolase/transferase [Bacillota bacterium]
MDRKPNILFIMCDQFRADVMSCAGGPARTPNLDSLAAEGIRFTDCSTVSPLCVPARISLMLGKYPHDTGAWDNARYILSPDADLWTKAIRDAGYATSVFGKLHLHSDYGDMIAYESTVRGYGFDTVNEISGPHSSTWTRTHLSEYWKEKGVWDPFCEDMDQRKLPYAKPSPLPLEDYYDVYVGRCGREYLERYDGEKPWFCHISFGGPHEPWDCPEPYASLYDPSEMPDPVPLTEDRNPDRPKGVVDKNYTKPTFRTDPENAKKLIANYCGEVTLIDEQIGAILETVKKRGEWDNTIVLFTSDHGELNGDHGMVRKRNYYRGALNVPLIVRTPETARAENRTCDAPVNLIDVGPTLASFAGAELDYHQFGLSLRPQIEGSAERPREYILAELSGERMYRDDEWKIVLNANGEVYQLFHRTEDPEDRINLAGDPAYAETERELTLKLFRAVCGNTSPKAALMQMKEPPLSDAFNEGYLDTIAIRPRKTE